MLWSVERWNLIELTVGYLVFIIVDILYKHRIQIVVSTELNSSLYIPVSMLILSPTWPANAPNLLPCHSIRKSKIFPKPAMLNLYPPAKDPGPICGGGADASVRKMTRKRGFIGAFLEFCD